jgi:hypothetical protein
VWDWLPLRTHLTFEFAAPSSVRSRSSAASTPHRHSIRFFCWFRLPELSCAWFGCFVRSSFVRAESTGAAQTLADGRAHRDRLGTRALEQSKPALLLSSPCFVTSVVLLPNRNCCRTGASTTDSSTLRSCSCRWTCRYTSFSSSSIKPWRLRV